MHISLDQAIGRQPRLNRVGDKLLQIAGGASAAYSLRSLTGNGGNAVRIRRSSDNVEVNVGFDGSGAVSTTSPITNVAEPTSVSFSSTWDIVTGTPASSTLSPLTSFRIIDAPSGFIVRLPITTAIAAGNSVDVSTFISTLSGSWDYYLGDFGGGIVSNVETITSGTTLPTLTATGTPYAIYLRSNTTTSSFAVSFAWIGTVTRGDTTSTNLGDFISGTNAHVVTWYDQSGNGNDAEQDTLNSQPLIAESGSLVTDGLKFDGTSDFLITSSSVLSGEEFLVSSVQSLTTTSGAGNDAIYGQYTAGTAGRTLISADLSANDYEFFSQGTNIIILNSSTVSTDKKLLTVSSDGTTAELFRDGSSADTDTSVNISIQDIGFAIGAVSDGTFPYRGSIEEIIVYNSDQSSKRSDIDTNIKNYYSIS